VTSFVEIAIDYLIMVKEKMNVGWKLKMHKKAEKDIRSVKLLELKKVCLFRYNFQSEVHIGLIQCPITMCVPFFLSLRANFMQSESFSF